MSIDREKVIKGLEMCIRHGENPSVRCGQKDECPYEQNGLPCWIDLSKDALAVLKEQEAVKPTWGRGKPFCGSCGLRIHGGKFCSECGKPIAWEGR